MSDTIPVTVLSGALGAGKTTTLNHVLTADHGLEVAVLVNDMGEVNVDVDHVDQQSQLSQTDEEVIEMSNGCICCRLRGDMLDAVGSLAASREFDYLLVESSGISEPIPVAQTFTLGFEDADYDPTTDYHLDTMVSVVDAHAMYEGFDSGAALADETAGGGTDRVPEEVLMDQIEFCDVLLLNKCDLVPDDELDAIEAVLETLQPRAEILRTEFGAVDPTDILDTGRFDFEMARDSAGWKHELQHDHHHDPSEEHGVESFVFRANRPVHPERFESLLYDLPESVIRAKGFFWSAGREDISMGLDKAGQSVRAGPNGRWIATLPPQEQRRYLQALPGLEDEWDDQWGDRGAELVFIGRNYDPQQLEARLEACLLTDDEMDDDWSRYPDPFGTERQREFALADD
ncbi:CobW domain protein [Natronomonas pharaonis DSM 2160]|uniref:CobW domain protein n=1 Tax=Natronomonas pharaonis (strain ATCC 35678 / DSM 2160 / CIP 103997 / JCM 8858 / NBRC 14720 / NCIMB 2260 / Gabara) TaxID=348780 RepID=A0A1U7EUG0_NATPD|nr:GTP-binding protein [Natronomonas pharaonis]CAI48609.1 CobW domain protein [Natronomonas pharaonis DSM 2160]